MAHLVIFTVLFLLCSINHAASELYHITATQTDIRLCTVPCFTMSQFAFLHSYYLRPNITLFFLPGRHHLSVNLTISNVNSFSMISENSTAQIECTSHSHIHFNHSGYIHIANLAFIGCGGNKVDNSGEFLLKDTKFRGHENSGTALELTETTAAIVNSSFVSHRKGTYVQTFHPLFRCGGAIIARRSKIDIRRSTFKTNGAEFGGAVYAEMGSIVKMCNNTFINNNATESGGVLYSYQSTVSIEASEFDSNTANTGGAIYSHGSNLSITESDFVNNIGTSAGVLYSYRSNITVETSEFDKNTVKWSGLLRLSYSVITIEASKFCDNYASTGILSSRRSTVKLNGSVFDNNTAVLGAAVYSRGSIITVQDSAFERNYAKRKGVLYGYVSTITVESSRFSNNTVRESGMLYFDRSSVQIGKSDFCNNSADYSGVIYSYNSNITTKTSTFEHNRAYRGGVVYSEHSNVTIVTSEFDDNFAQFGGVLYTYYGNVTIEASKFNHNSGLLGGVLYSEDGNVEIEESKFDNNIAKLGAVVYSTFSNITIEASGFDGNTAELDGSYFSRYYNPITVVSNQPTNDIDSAKYGGVVYSKESNVTIRASTFNKNTAAYKGGVLYSDGCNITVEASKFKENVAFVGGVLHSYLSTVKLKWSDFHNTTSTDRGGLTFYQSTVTMDDTNFTNNNSTMGAVIYAKRTKIKQLNSLQIAHNSVGKYAVVFLADSEFYGRYSGNLTFSNNIGSVMAFNSSVVFAGYARFVNNTQPPTTTSGIFQEGGAITLFQSSLFVDGICHIEHNLAENGGAILSSMSKLYVNGVVNITHNRASVFGGGVYLVSSELNCHKNSTFMLLGNTALSKGGGIHALSADIKAISSYEWGQDSIDYVGARLNFIENTARMGGGLTLAGNAKLYILKYVVMYDYIETDTNTAIFTGNTADYGGAVYVDDDTNSGTCTSALNTECFFQVLAIHGENLSYIKTESIHFSQNSASISGGTLYGGLLDRCGLNPLAEVLYKNWTYWEESDSNGVAYLNDVSTSTNLSISSRPVRVCLFVSEGLPCTNQKLIEVKKGETFTVSLIAVDQISNPVSGTIQSSLNFSESGLAEGQLTREIPGECTNLTFNVVSPHATEKLILHASDGPCKDAELSTATIEIHFIPCSCPIGFQIQGNNKTNCSCECHTNIRQYVEQCDRHTGTLVKSSQSSAWISYINDTNLTGYLVYPNCPFDYCNSQSPPINLNHQNGGDFQCAFNRSSLLCGSCRPGLSLSLASSRCLSCPSYWPALLVAITLAAVLAGIALVALLLVLNATVAIGTLNGLIFYANIVYANKSILLQFKETNFVTVFISWLNFELGIDTCYFPGMDTYTKTWLQLAFPAYVILLVVLVIIISSYSTRFSNLIGKKDPVASLATLILLSYAKLLEICFKSLSVGILEYPNGSNERLWLPNANVKYLSGKHIPLFIAAVLILLVGLVYTTLVFSWQWLLLLPKWKVFSCIRNQKLQTFVETYLTPYTPKHRFWTGLLLLVRVVLYLVATVNVSNDPHVPLTAIVFTMCCIVFLGRFTGIRVYRKWTVDILDTFFCLNILFFTLFTWYSLSDQRSNQKAAAYASVGITIIVLLLIILYHMYTYTSVFSKVKESKAGRMLDRFLNQSVQPQPKPKRQSPTPDDDIHRFHEVLDMIDHRVNTNDYNVPQRQQAAAPTHTVVEVLEPHHSPSNQNMVDKTNVVVTTETVSVEDQNIECSTEETGL